MQLARVVTCPIWTTEWCQNPLYYMQTRKFPSNYLGKPDAYGWLQKNKVTQGNDIGSTLAMMCKFWWEKQVGPWDGEYDGNHLHTITESLQIWKKHAPTSHYLYNFSALCNDGSSCRYSTA